VAYALGASIKPAIESVGINRSGDPRSPSDIPGTRIDACHVEAAGAVIVTLAGMIGRDDADPLSRKLHIELDGGPRASS
jgi:hypothetical protein